MPTYMVIRYFTSRVSNTCEDCVKEKTDGYDDILNLVSELGTGSSNDVTETTEPAVQQHSLGMITNLAKNIDELRTEMTNMAQKMNNFEAIKPEKSLYSDIVRSTTPDTVQHVLVKTKDPNQQPRTDAISAALKTVPITKMTTNSSGHLKITLPHLKAKSDALKALSISQDVVSKHKVSAVRKLLPKITICSVPPDIDDDELKQCVMDKNPIISDLVADGEKFEVLFSKTPENGSKMAIVCVSPLVRDVIMKTSALYIQNMRCGTYDRYWVRRCGHCL
ncbi:hypothetical protein Pmani_014588 [Petrolisthes manimaculis]|uniref:Uncharacterized protein n=1 Tax=Petrolisthes manimaculis TaxID=1843537 RepID=A0AAE1PVF2_9EUCA|nr:hypothetical protein Pmani_014588 [Petrolisthes manimaculis]